MELSRRRFLLAGGAAALAAPGLAGLATLASGVETEAREDAVWVAGSPAIPSVPRFEGDRKVDQLLADDKAVKRLAESIPGTVVSIFRHQRQHFVPPSQTVQRTVQKVGRNDPCPCGSGRKYKKCCGANSLP